MQALHIKQFRFPGMCSSNKIFSTFSLLFALVFSLNAQPGAKNAMLFGVHGGINYSLFEPGVSSISVANLSSDGGTAISRGAFTGNIGYHFGINFLKPLNQTIAIEIAPQQFNQRTLYNSEEVIEGVTPFTLSREISTISQYYRFPVSVKYWNRNNTWQPYAFFGVSYGFMSRASSSVVETISTALADGSERSTINTSENAIGGALVKSRIDLLGGIGIMYDFSSFLIGLDARMIFLLNDPASSGNRYQASGGIASVANQKFHSPSISLKILLKIDSDKKKGGLICYHVQQEKSRK